MNRIKLRELKNADKIQKIISVFILFLMMIVSYQPSAYATENGGCMYPGGNEDFAVGILPPPGMYAMLYTMYYSADKKIDNNGDEIPIDFELDLYATVLRFIHTTEKKVLGADYAWQLIVPLGYANIEMNDFNIDESTSGLLDVEFSPFILGWHVNKNLHIVGAMEFWVPTGKYDQDDPSSLGRNYWSMAPVFVATYISDSGFEISGKFQYLINTENSDTDFTSGHEFMCDYLIGQHLGNWSLGINGYIYKQITDDEQNGNTIEDNKGQCISIGPAIQYNYKNIFISAKAQFDTAVENRVEGQKFWLKFFYAF